jgi:hypothetical protein
MELAIAELAQELQDQRAKIKEEMLAKIRRNDLEYFREDAPSSMPGRMT